MESYNEFATKQAPVIAQLESSYRSLSFLLPGRFKNSEVISQALYSFTTLLSNYHDSILYKQYHQQHPQKESLLNRHLQYILQNKNYNYLNTLLVLINSLQTFIEMVSFKINSQIHQKTIITITFIKTILRLALFKRGNFKMVLHPQVIERTFDLNDIKEQQKPLVWTANRTKKQFKTVGSLLKKTFEQPLEYLLSRAGETESKNLLRPLIGYERIKEGVYIIRPLLYVLLWSKFGKSYKTFLPSLIIHLWTLFPENEENKTMLEKQEDTKRKWLLVYYFLQYPLYEKFTSVRVKSIVDYLKGKMVVGAVGTILNDYSFLWDEYHFCTIGY
jgi:peroxin-16